MSERPPPKRPRDPSLSFDFSASFPFPLEAAPAAPAEPVVLSVAELGRTIRGGVDSAFPRAVLVRGEVANARPAASGHLYFTLKDEDEDAMIDVVVYKSSLTPRARGLVKDGSRIRVRGKPAFWAPRGRLQMVGDRDDDEGKGALLEALERLKAKLLAEGLFDPERKRALPSEPRIVGVVTSETGAVIHDIVRVAARRGGAHVLLAPARVQGAGAAESMVRALELLSRIAGVDVIILGRGGGAADDLLAFSDEALVRAVAACRVPVVAAVGHDVDVPLVDFVADARAATPSQAAEMLVPDRAARRALLQKNVALLSRAMQVRLTQQRNEWLRAQGALSDPRLVLASWQQKKDDFDARLAQAAARIASERSRRVAQLGKRLALLHPRVVLVRERAAVDRLTARMASLVSARLARERATLANRAASLDALSPLKVLSRGYAIALTASGQAVRRAGDLKPGDAISLRVHSGKIHAIVAATEGGEAER